jgi:hypothetical protein
MRSAKRSLCATVLAAEAIIVGLTIPVMITISDVSAATALWIGLGLAVGCLLTAGLLRSEWGYWLGHTLQLAAIALGVVVPLMFFLGPILALLWGTAFLVGRKIERERAAWDAEQPSVD